MKTAMGGAVLLIFGSARGLPPRAGVYAGMAELNTPLAELTVAPRQTWGAREFDGTTRDGKSTAFAIAVVFRVSSAYLPPVAGWFSLHWLQRNDYL